MRRLQLAMLGMFAIANVALARVDLNSASLKELESIKGLGPEKAKAIIDYRTKNGKFKSLEDVSKVNGIGNATMEKIKADIKLDSGAAYGNVPDPCRKNPLLPQCSGWTGK